MRRQNCVGSRICGVASTLTPTLWNCTATVVPGAERRRHRISMPARPLVSLPSAGDHRQRLGQRLGVALERDGHVDTHVLIRRRRRGWHGPGTGAGTEVETGGVAAPATAASRTERGSRGDDDKRERTGHHGSPGARGSTDALAMGGVSSGATSIGANGDVRHRHRTSARAVPRCHASSGIAWTARRASARRIGPRGSASGASPTSPARGTSRRRPVEPGREPARSARPAATDGAGGVATTAGFAGRRSTIDPGSGARLRQNASDDASTISAAAGGEAPAPRARRPVAAGAASASATRVRRSDAAAASSLTAVSDGSTASTAASRSGRG